MTEAVVMWALIMQPNSTGAYAISGLSSEKECRRLGEEAKKLYYFLPGGTYVCLKYEGIKR